MSHQEKHIHIRIEKLSDNDKKMLSSIKELTNNKTNSKALLSAGHLLVKCIEQKKEIDKKIELFKKLLFRSIDRLDEFQDNLHS